MIVRNRHIGGTRSPIDLNLILYSLLAWARCNSAVVYAASLLDGMLWNLGGTWGAFTTRHGKALNSVLLLHVIMTRTKKIAIWAVILGGGLAYYMAYGHIADLMR